MSNEHALPLPEDISIKIKEGKLSLPDPTPESAHFIAWLKKRGCIQELRKCKKKWDKENISVEEIVRRLGSDLIKIYRSRGGEKVVVLKNKVWADQWLTHYDLEVPHHGQRLRTEIIISVTENENNI